MKTNNSKLWYRLGDADDYHFVECLDEMLEVLEQFDVGCDITRRMRGIASSRYRGDNYISLYWGDDESNYEALISDQEFEKIQNTFNEVEE